MSESDIERTAVPAGVPVIEAWQPYKDSMGGSGPMPFVFTEQRAAEIWAEDHKEEWTTYKVNKVLVRQFTRDEGAVKDQLVRIRHERSADLLKARAIKKLTDEERRALGLP